jgi:hypothetical protein
MQGQEMAVGHNNAWTYTYYIDDAHGNIQPQYIDSPRGPYTGHQMLDMPENSQEDSHEDNAC